MKAIGIIVIIMGLLAIASPAVVGLSVAVLVGALVLACGGAQLVWALRSESLGKGLTGFAIGGLTLACGVVLVTDPIFASGVLTIILAVYFLLDGLVESAAALRARPSQGWGWLLAGGVFSLFLAVLIWRQFPLSGAWAIGVLLGIKLLMVGMVMLFLGPITLHKVLEESPLQART